MDLTRISATTLTADLCARRLSAQELMAATYDQIAAWNPQVNALVSVTDREAAMALAREADCGDVRGPLHGLPIAIKDLVDAAGFVTTKGARLFSGRAPALRDDLPVARLRAAGALVIGKSNTPEFGLGSHTTNPVHGPTRNPYDPTRSAGGSSGGASAALASGMLALADGSDMMGSLRNPAGWTNTYGLRPTVGAVPSEPSGDMYFNRLSTCGPLARSPDDLALLLSVLAGPDPRQPFGVSLAQASSARPLRIGWLGDWDGAYPMEDGVLAQCEGALAVFSEVGHEITPCTPGFSAAALWESWTTLRAWQVSAASLLPDAPDATRRAQLGSNARWELARAEGLSALEVHRASVTRSQWFTRARALFETHDVLALPTAQVWPFDVTLDWPKQIAGQLMDSYHRWMEVVVPASLIGLPALAVPAGFGTAGLPMGLQLIGPPGSDYDLLRAARAFHGAAPWTETRPAMPGAEG